jgi:hypothetical protein
VKLAKLAKLTKLAKLAKLARLFAICTRVRNFLSSRVDNLLLPVSNRMISDCGRLEDTYAMTVLPRTRHHELTSTGISIGSRLDP